MMPVFFIPTNFILIILLLAICSLQMMAAFPTNSSHQQLYQSHRQSELSSDSDDLKTFPRSGEFELVLEKRDEFEFEMCCESGNCTGSLSFHFSVNEKKQSDGTLSMYGCEEGTCAYHFEYKADHKYELFVLFSFETTETCLTGKLDKDKVYAAYSTDGVNAPGCSLQVDAEKRFKIYVRSIPEGVTVKAKNAKKYIEPTTTTTTTTPAATTQSKETATEVGKADGLRYGLIGFAVFLVLLGIIGIIVVGYCILKPKKSKKPNPAANANEPSSKKLSTVKQKKLPVDASDHRKSMTVNSGAEGLQQSKQSVAPARQSKRTNKTENLRKTARATTEATNTVSNYSRKADRKSKKNDTEKSKQTED